MPKLRRARVNDTLMNELVVPIIPQAGKRSVKIWRFFSNFLKNRILSIFQGIFCACSQQVHNYYTIFLKKINPDISIP